MTSDRTSTADRASSRTVAPAATLWPLGLATCLGLAALALVDQSGWHLTSDAVAAHYHPYGKDPDPAQLTTALAVFFGLGALAWWGSGRLARRGAGKALLLTHMTGSWLTAAVFAAVCTSAHEFGGYVMAPLWRGIVWLPVLLGLVALVRSARARRA